MTPRVYEELGFQRLPMAITTNHLYATLRSEGIFDGFNYHNLGEDILKQIPEQLKKPLCIVQDPNNEAEIVSVIALHDKNGKQIIIPIAYSQKGNLNGAEIDINLVKSVYGRENFQKWLEATIADNRLLYINKKETEPAVAWRMEAGFQAISTLSASRSVLPPGPNPPDVLQNIFGFLTENVARYKETVKEKFPERFRPVGERILFKIGDQLTLDFDTPSQPTETIEKQVQPPLIEHTGMVIPFPNTPENFAFNFSAIAEEFKSDRIEAARFLLRDMAKEDRETTLAQMRENGCTDKESFHRYLYAILSPEPKEENRIAAESKEQNLTPYGAWSDFDSRLSLRQREEYNRQGITILQKAADDVVSDEDKAILRRYSGFGGISADNERGVLYDYYTSPPVAHLVWQLLEKSGGISDDAKILEPSCGSGVFFEYAPQNKSLNITGVELDARTAQVADLLHTNEKTEVLHMSFEAFNLSDKAGGYDHVIGNAPFGERGAELAALDMSGEKSLDNYFVSRAIDNLKPEGTMALIAAPGVLENKTNEGFRLEVNKKAQFIGAVKLPDRSFRHTHTQVMPDILLFRKHPDDIQKRIATIDEQTFKSTPLCDTDFIGGTYFENHPEHIAGQRSLGTGQWGNDEIKGDITAESLSEILSSFSPQPPLDNIYDELRQNVELHEVSKKEARLLLSSEEIKLLESKQLRAGAVKVYEKGVYVLTDEHSWLSASADETLAEKISQVKAIASSVQSVQQAMKDEADVELIKQHQQECLKQLSEYEQKNNTLPADDPLLKRFIRENPAVQGIYETFISAGDPLLTQKNVYRKEIDITDGHQSAVTALLTLREKMKEGAVNNIMSSFPENGYSLLKEMQEHKDIFLTTEGVFQLREDFISGDAWKKIDELREAAAGQEDEADQNDPHYVYHKFADPGNFKNEYFASAKQLFLRGADELEKAVGWTAIEDADFSPRSSWVPEEVVRQWASGEEALGNGNLRNLAKNSEGKWGVTTNGVWEEEADPLVYYLNGQKQRSRYYDTDAFNREHDDLFRSFISSHESYRELLESTYNRTFKTHIIAPVKTYHVDIAGWRQAEAVGAGKTLKGHQWQSIHHLYRNQCGISALGTGFGKTATAIGLMSLLRQEGKAKRVFLQVPNNKVKDWVQEISDVMPSLKIACIDPEEQGYSSRDKRYAKYQAMARSDADIIIMPESSASEIQLSPEKDTEVTKHISHLYRLEKEGASERQKEMAALKGEYKAQSGKTNSTICFEDFGCDALVVDEAHRYKNLFSSSLSRETGLNDGRQSVKAMSLYKKSEYIRRENNGKNVFLLTATPLTNSPLEYYNMMQYIAPQELRRMGVATIDGFIREFANIQTGWLYDWSSGQAKQGRILTGFKNLSTLQNLFFSYTDFQNNPDAIGLEKPRSENQPHIIAADEKQMEAVKSISLELDEYKSLGSKEREVKFPGENFLTFYSRMRTASLDLELYDPQEYSGWKNPKLTTLAQNAFDTYSRTKAGQVVFCDRVFSSDGSFNIHEKIKAELVAQGFKEKEIVIVNGFTKGGGAKSDSAVEKEVSKAIADYNSGKYKVIIGSTACIGEGVNLQKNSSAAHHFDIPFRPSDFIQRNGRVDRQGNEQKEVTLHTYLASGTIDNYSVNLVQRKANWIDQLLRTKSSVFTNPNDENSIDADELQLALSEEWGDKEAAQKRREELEKQKQEKITEAQSIQMKAHLKNLSLARGALVPLEGKEHTAEYKKRITQIGSIETALKANPMFDNISLLENRKPFLYNGETGMIFRRDDIFVTQRGERYLVKDFNFKKQEITCAELLSDEEKKDRQITARIYGRPADFSRNFKVSELTSETDSYSRSSIYCHFQTADEKTKEVVKALALERFYSFGNDEKEKYYGLHLNVVSGRSRDFDPLVFSRGDEGCLKIERAQYRDSGFEPLNPFSREGKADILNAIDNGIQYNTGDSDLLETIEKTVPELEAPLKQAIEKAEKQKALERSLLEQVAEKTSADIQQLASRVHVARSRF
jgi:hypothetical protein